MSTYTPGPWRLHPIGRMVLGRAFDESERAIVDQVRGQTPDQALANAHLITAAPDLLKVAHAAYHALKSYQYGNDAPALAEKCAEALVVAIAKAEGR